MFALVLGLVAGCDQGNNDAGRGSGNDACPVGKWESDKDTVLEALGLPDDPEFNVDASGAFTLEFTRTNFNGRWDMAVAVSSGNEKADLIVDATIKGTWSGPDDNIEMTLSEARGTMKTTIDGESTTEDLGGAWEDSSEPAVASCSGSTLKMDMGNGAEMAFKRK